jgi:predicted nucleotidyltransferase
MTEEQFRILENLVILPLKNHNFKLFIFGSRAVGNFHPHSDVDILFQVPPGQHLPSGLLSRIKESIEDSRFPFSVDLVNQEELAESYRNQVSRERIEI